MEIPLPDLEVKGEPEISLDENTCVQTTSNQTLERAPETLSIDSEATPKDIEATPKDSEAAPIDSGAGTFIISFITSAKIELAYYDRMVFVG